jgi:thymidylate kinase
LAAEIGMVLAGRRPAAELPGRARRALARCTLRPSGLGATWAQRRTVLPAGRSAGPLGARVRDVVVALVGTDGAGKSTVGTELAARLRRCGFEVRETYFGMARDNLPGVTLARRLLRVPAAGTGEPTATPTATPTGVEPEPEPVPGAGSPGPTLSLPLLRRAAAWYYAVEYLWRYLRRVLPHRLRRRVVLCDRWVCDLRGSPWPGSPAARVVERLVPPPDLLVLPDAPAEVLHRRKPERPMAEQARQQEELRQLLRTAPARSTAVVVDTSGQTHDPVGPLLAAVVRAAHSARGVDPAQRPGG